MKRADENQTDREILQIFAENLRQLTQAHPSVSDLCRDLDINRSQFNRYLAGTAVPRTLALKRICEYFDVDARILHEPLANVQQDRNSRNSDAFSILEPALVPASQHLLPDGIYAEWRLATARLGEVSLHFVRIYTEDGHRKLRVRASAALGKTLGETGSEFARNLSHGRIYQQVDGFITFDRGEDTPTIAMTAFRAGYSTKVHLYQGIKLIGRPYTTTMPHSCGPVLLERIEPTRAALRRVMKHPRFVKIEDAPEYVRRLLLELTTNSFASPFHLNWPST